MYKQTLFKVLENHVKPKVLKRNNRYKKWEYGYNQEHDMVVISKTGEIGEVYEIQNLKIALPKQSEDVVKFKSNKWERTQLPKAFKRIKTIFDWEEYDVDFKETWYDYIDKEFEYREKGFWFINKDKPTYLTGTHYMYLQWSKIDVGKPDFRESNRLFFIFWEACKADIDHMEFVTLKTDDLVFRSWPQVKLLTAQQYQQTQDLEYYLNQDLMLKQCLPTRLYQSRLITRFSSSQYKTVWTVQKQN